MSFLSELFNKKKQPQNSYEQRVRKPSEVVEDEFEEDEDSEAPVMEELKEELESQSEEVYEVVEREIHPAKIICPDCGGITLEGLELCDKCGGELL